MFFFFFFFVEELAYCLIQTKKLLSGEWLVILCRCKLCKEWLFIKASLAYLQLSWSDGKVSGWNSGIISAVYAIHKLILCGKAKIIIKTKGAFSTWLHRKTLPSSNFWAHRRKSIPCTSGRICQVIWDCIHIQSQIPESGSLWIKNIIVKSSSLLYFLIQYYIYNPR